MNEINCLLLGVLLVTVLWAVLANSLIRAAIGLAAVSAVLTIMMFQMGSPLAAVFELSVCAGLITVVFVSIISLTRPLTGTGPDPRIGARRARFLPVVGVMVVVGLLLWLKGYSLDVPLPPAGTGESVREALWNGRRLDLVGQVIVLLAGVFGVVLLFKERLLPRAGEPQKGEVER